MNTSTGTSKILYLAIVWLIPVEVNTLGYVTSFHSREQRDFEIETGFHFHVSHSETGRKLGRRRFVNNSKKLVIFVNM